MDVDVGVGDEPLDELLGPEHAAVHLAHGGALDHQIEGPPHLPDRVHAVIDASRPEAVLGGLVAGARLAELVFQGDAHVVVGDLAVVAPPAPDLDAADDPDAVSFGTMICIMRPVSSPLPSVQHMTMTKSARSPFEVNIVAARHHREPDAEDARARGAVPSSKHSCTRVEIMSPPGSRPRCSMSVPKCPAMSATAAAASRTLPAALADHFVRNVRHWRDGGMLVRWIAAGLLDTSQCLRGIRGCNAATCPHSSAPSIAIR